MTMDARTAFDIAPCGLVTVDEFGRIADCNATFALWSGRPAASLPGLNFAALLDSGSRIFYETRFMPTLRLETTVHGVALSLDRLDGTKLHAVVNAVVADDGLIHLALMDSRERAEFERELVAARRLAEESELRVRVLQNAAGAFSSSEDETELASAVAGSIREAFSATATGVFVLDAGGELELVSGTDPFLASPPTSRPQHFARELGETLAFSTVGEATLFSAGLGAAMDAARVSSVSATPLETSAGRVGIVVTSFARERILDSIHSEVLSALALQAAEVFVRFRLRRELEYLAQHDSLTGLANRELFQRQFDRALARTDVSLAVLFLDLDGFKSVNDAYGHAAGDAVLKQAGARLEAAISSPHVLSRFGGDEFVMIFRYETEAEVEDFAEGLRMAIVEPYAEAPASRVSASIGVALIPAGRETSASPSDALTIADNAMYDAKALGKDRTVIAYV